MLSSGQRFSVAFKCCVKPPFSWQTHTYGVDRAFSKISKVVWESELCILPIRTINPLCDLGRLKHTWCKRTSESGAYFPQRQTKPITIRKGRPHYSSADLGIFHCSFHARQLGISKYCKYPPIVTGKSDSSGRFRGDRIGGTLFPRDQVLNHQLRSIWK